MNQWYIQLTEDILALLQFHPFHAFCKHYNLTRQCAQVHSLLTNLNTTAMVAPKREI